MYTCIFDMHERRSQRMRWCAGWCGRLLNLPQQCGKYL